MLRNNIIYYFLILHINTLLAAYVITVSNLRPEPFSMLSDLADEAHCVPN